VSLRAPDMGEPILTVGELARLIKESLEEQFPALWVRGEVTGCKRGDTGHLYFSLKEGRKALVDCFMFRSDAVRLSFDPRDGMEVEAFGGVSVYELRGRFQLVVREMRPAGRGALLLALEELKRRLQAEGLFDSARKKPLPAFPSRVGLVTSPTGAAVRDMLRVLRQRWPGLGIVFAPVRVQGEGAAEEIAAAIRRFGRYGRVDVVIVGRGGGSLEELWEFNDERVVRAIAASRIPIVTAIGHEVDWTLADFAADHRAATPSHAAELVVPRKRDVEQGAAALAARLRRVGRLGLAERNRRVQALLEQYGFRRLRDALRPLTLRVGDLDERLRRATDRHLRGARGRLREALQRYGLRELPRGIAARRGRVAALAARRDALAGRALRDRRGHVASLEHRLRALSPRHVLERGFCIARDADGSLVRSTEQLAIGDRLTVELARGEADTRVEALRPEAPRTRP
jgi:exodeoxyribonuclease VII large subunit